MFNEHKYRRSEIQTWIDCPTKWRLQWQEGLENTEQDFYYANLGTDIHNQIAEWYGGGKESAPNFYLEGIFTMLDLPEDLIFEQKFEYDNLWCTADAIDLKNNIIYEFKTTNHLQKGTWQHLNNFQTSYYKYIIDNARNQTHSLILIIIERPSSVILKWSDKKQANFNPSLYFEKLTIENFTNLSPYLEIIQKLEYLRKIKEIPPLIKNPSHCKLCSFAKYCATGDNTGVIKHDVTSISQ